MTDLQPENVDFENLSISGNSAISGNSETGKKNLGPIARPLNKKNKTNQKIGQLGRYRAKQGLSQNYRMQIT